METGRTQRRLVRFLFLPSLTLRSHGTGRIFYRLKNVTKHFVYTGPLNILVVFTRPSTARRLNFHTVKVRFYMNREPSRTNFRFRSVMSERRRKAPGTH